MKEFELEPGEHVVKEVRKHWFLFLGELLPFAILAVLPFALPKLLALAPPMATYATLFDYHSILGRAMLGVWLLIMWTSAWGAFTRYFLNAWVLTNQRIATIKQRRFFFREVSSLLLPRVQDVTTNVTGAVSRTLNRCATLFSNTSPLLPQKIPVSDTIGFMNEPLSTDPYKGVRDFYPADWARMEALFARISETLARWGYEEYNASPLERAELYEA